MGNVEQAVQFMLDVANDNKHGYDQGNRYGPNYDCSSLLGTALSKADFDVSPYSWTGNLRKQLLDCGFKIIPVTSERKRGDIFLSERHHVVMCIDSANIVHASINEKGTITGGQSGDQTGKEICTRSFYTPSYGWDYHFRHESVEETTDTNTNIVAGKQIALNNIKCYQSETTSTVSGTKTGAYYLWDNVVKYGRIRITNKPERVGVKGQVTCWINVADIGLTTLTPSTPTITQPVQATPVKEVKCTGYASKYDRFLANTYTVTVSWLNVRNGAGTSEKILVAIPKGTEVKCYGYYTLVGTTKWCLVQFIYKEVKYTGFLSSVYLKP